MRARTIATAALVVALVLAAPLGATASTQPTNAVAADNPFTPSPNKWRAWMINMLSSVLGAATPTKYKAEQIANAYKFDHSFEQWEAQMGIDSVRTDSAGNMIGIKWTNKGTGTYEDVVVSGLQDQLNSKLVAKGSGPVRAPATPMKTFVKTVAGTLTVVSAYDLSATLSAAGVNLVGGWMGVDTNGIVCAQAAGTGLLGTFTQLASGQNCDAFTQAAQYIANQDVASGPTLTYLGVTITYLGQGVNAVGGAPGFCYKQTGGTLATRYQIYLYKTDGTTSGFVSGTVGNATCAPSSAGNRIWVGSGSWPSGISPIIHIKDSGTTGTPEVSVMTQPTGADVDRQNQCGVKYTDGSTLLGPLSPTYKESTGEIAQPACPSTPAGKVPDQVTVTQKSAGNPDQTLQQQNTTTPYKNWVTNYPECSIGACQLDLIDLTKPTKPSCFDEDTGCPGWWDDANKATDYQCRYGVHNVDISECAVYAVLFEPGHTTAGAPYADPNTGTWSGGQNAPTTGAQAMAKQVQNPDALRTCDFPDFAMDPVSWVLRPGQCLLEWAFVPRQAVISVDMAGASDKWAGKAPAVLAAAVTTQTLHPQGSGCSKSVTVMGVTFDIWNACTGAMATLASWCRIVIDFAVVIGVILVIRRQIAGMVGYGRGES